LSYLESHVKLNYLFMNCCKYIKFYDDKLSLKKLWDSIESKSWLRHCLFCLVPELYIFKPENNSTQISNMIVIVVNCSYLVAVTYSWRYDHAHLCHDFTLKTSLIYVNVLFLWHLSYIMLCQGFKGDHHLHTHKTCRSEKLHN
jgi:hypothetical protein